jgi:hypothetical protein
MITGNPHSGLQVRTYVDEGEAVRFAREFIAARS